MKMKKNEYIAPEMEIVEITEKYALLLETSGDGAGGDVGDGTTTNPGGF